jgi:hypothetical protein
VDDEQGPWWTRPPEPGPQVPASARRGPHEDDQPDQDQLDGAGAAVDDGAPSRPAPTPEPPPPPRPRQQIRRVAVVNPRPEPAEPPGPPVGHPPHDHIPAGHTSSGHPSSQDRTENLPAVGDDIFAVFDASGRPGHPAGPAPGPTAMPPLGAAGGTPYEAYAGTAEDDPLGHLRDEPQPHRLHVPRVEIPEPRVLLIAAGSGLVVLLMLLVVLVFDNGGDSDRTASPTPTAAAHSATAGFAGKMPDGLKKLSDGQAAELLKKAGQGSGGTIVEAWSWNDDNGRNLVVTTTEAVSRNRQSLRVIHLAHLETARPRTLRLMIDPGLPRCRNSSTAGYAGFTKYSVLVRDVNGDGVAEVTAGWSSRCGAKTGSSEIKLALITNGTKYIIREQGVIGKAGAGTPAPRASKWPAGFYTALRRLYTQLYA